MKHRYSLIIESDTCLADDEIKKLTEDLLAMYNGNNEVISSFTLVSAINLEGIKVRHTWQKNLYDTCYACSSCGLITNGTDETTEYCEFRGEGELDEKS